MGVKRRSPTGAGIRRGQGGRWTRAPPAARSPPATVPPIHLRGTPAECHGRASSSTMMPSPSHRFRLQAPDQGCKQRRIRIAAIITHGTHCEQPAAHREMRAETVAEIRARVAVGDRDVRPVALREQAFSIRIISTNAEGARSSISQRKPPLLDTYRKSSRNDELPGSTAHTAGQKGSTVLYAKRARVVVSGGETGAVVTYAGGWGVVEIGCRNRMES